MALAGQSSFLYYDLSSFGALYATRVFEALHANQLYASSGMIMVLYNLHLTILLYSKLQSDYLSTYMSCPLSWKTVDDALTKKNAQK